MKSLLLLVFSFFSVIASANMYDCGRYDVETDSNNKCFLISQNSKVELPYEGVDVDVAVYKSGDIEVDLSRGQVSLLEGNSYHTTCMQIYTK